MPRANDIVETLLIEYADLLSITGGDPFRVRTYEKAARSVGGYHADVATLDEHGLQGIANVGSSTAKKILEILETGSFAQLDELRQQVPAGVRQMMAISTLGPKKAMTLYHDLHIASIEELMDAIH
ncbi:MAG: DNA polymerase/3'-5' exonuclease PolX, partial [Actinomycetota bacterium]|nr:DNA polymerase/3'-5' exonuclease PolX [Actinomycetota bacterium]